MRKLLPSLVLVALIGSACGDGDGDSRAAQPQGRHAQPPQRRQNRAVVSPFLGRWWQQSRKG
jgi:hypothetical protein